MPNRGLLEFTVQEADNFDAYKNWKYEALSLVSDNAYVDAAYITSTDPAKKVIIYNKPGVTAFSGDSNEFITVKINGDDDAGKEIKIDAGDVPFTISGMIITSISLKTSDSTGDEHLAVLSFH